jgi:hypothetical protein
MKKGFSEAESIQKVKEHQATLNDKPQDEIDRINVSKGSPHSGHVNEPGLLYYIRFYNNDIEFWKVGITNRTIAERFSKRMLSGLNMDIIYSIPFDNLSDAYIVEQIILKNKLRITVEYDMFRSTECFTKDLINAI